MGGGKRDVGVMHNAQHAQGASARVHGVVGVWGKAGCWIPIFYASPVDEEDDEDEDGAVG
jgi:hypothetical protein